MNRTQKEAVVAQLRDSMASAPASFLVKYQGATVDMLQAFRAGLRNQQAQFKVAKARLMKIAAADVPGADAFAEQFQDQVGLVFADGDVSAAAKEISTFAKANGAIQVLSGLFEQKVLSAAEVKYLASLPSREVLLAQVLGTLQAPVATFVRQLSMLILQLLYVLQRIAEKKAEAA
ncbi:MAG: 50S ribosomal protein L10 [Candidatus Dependentiae bacterium]|jgi:large subunit ribosomal protein L10